MKGMRMNGMIRLKPPSKGKGLKMPKIKKKGY